MLQKSQIHYTSTWISFGQNNLYKKSQTQMTNSFNSWFNFTVSKRALVYYQFSRWENELREKGTLNSSTHSAALEPQLPLVHVSSWFRKNSSRQSLSLQVTCQQQTSDEFKYSSYVGRNGNVGRNENGLEWELRMGIKINYLFEL